MCIRDSYSLLARTRRYLKYLGYQVCPTRAATVAFLYRYDGSRQPTQADRTILAADRIGLRRAANGQYRSPICAPINSRICPLLAGKRHRPVLVEYQIPPIREEPMGSTQPQSANGIQSWEKVQTRFKGSYQRSQHHRSAVRPKLGILTTAPRGAN